MTVLGAVGHRIHGITTTGAARTDKTSDTVAGQGVIVIREVALVGSTSDYLAVYNSTESTETDTALGDFTLMKADVAGNSVFCPRGIFWKTVGFAGSRVNLLYLRPNFLKVGSYAICTVSNYIRDDRTALTTFLARAQAVSRDSFANTVHHPVSNKRSV